MKKLIACLLLAAMVCSLGACGKQEEGAAEVQYRDDVDLETLKTAVVEAVGEDNYWPNMELDAQSLEEVYGVSSDLYEDFLGEIPMISAHVDSMILVKAKAGKAGDVSEALNAYKTRNLEEGLNYPGNLPKINGSVIEIVGNYVCFLQLGGDTTAASEEGDEAVLAHCQEVNQQAVAAIQNALKE